MAFALSHTLAPTSGAICPKTSLCSRNGSLPKQIVTKPHEDITYKGSNKANAQHHKAICNIYYICCNTDMFSQSLESPADFIMFKHGNHWKWSATYAHSLQWITLTLMKTEQTVSITLETQVSLTTHTFDICFLLFLFLFVTFFYNCFFPWS